MKRTTFRALFLPLMLSLLVVACSGRHSKQDNSSSQSATAAAAPTPAPKIGEEQVASNPAPVVESREITRTISSEIPTVRVTELKGDLNRMSETNFEVLGVPQDLARNIVQYRSSKGGRFSSLDDLRAVPGMSTNVFDQLRDKVAIAQ